MPAPDLAPEWSPIAGWLSQPATAGDFGVVILPPVGYAYSSSHRFWRSLAEALAAHGITVLRVDYPGTGDSAGVASRLHDLTPWRAALRHALAELTSRGITRVALVGGQLGATFALMDGPSLAPAGIVSVLPVMNGRRLVSGLRMIGDKAPADVGGVAVGGYYFSAGLLDEIGSLSASEPAGVPHLLLTHESGVGAFMERAAEEATVDPDVVTSVVDWIRSLAGTQSAAASSAAVAAPRAPRRAAAVVNPDDRADVHERFVTMGPDELVGVLTSADAATDIPDDVYVLVNSGSDPHIGPGRAWVELARHLAARGRATVRVDLRSWGESPAGPTVPGRPGDNHAIGDVIRAVEALNDGGRRRVVLGSLCAGAWTSMEAARHVDVAGLVVLNANLYWQPGDPTEPLLKDTRARRMPEILWIKEQMRRGRWDEEDRRGLRPPAGAWLDDLVRLGRKTSLLFAEGDDGLEYLQDRLARRLRKVVDSGLVHVVEMMDVDHAMHRSWQRSVVFDAIANELDWILGTAATTSRSPAA